VRKKVGEMEKGRDSESKRGREGGEARKKERERDMKREKGVQIYNLYSTNLRKDA